MERTKRKVVWGAVERQGKTFWSRIGLAWESRSGALYARISAVPLNGRLCVTPGSDEPQGDEVIELLTGEAAP